jgi:hypothetical protein
MLDDFNLLGLDLLHQGNEDGNLLQSVESVRRAYND